MLSDVGVNHVGGDGGHLVKPGFAELALYVVFGGKAKAAVVLQTNIGRFPTGFGGEVLGHIRFGAAGLLCIKQSAGFVAHQVGSFHFDIGIGNRKLHPLVLPDGAAKDLTLLGVLADAVDKPVAITNAFGGDQGALGVQAIQDVFKALPFLPYEVVYGQL